MGCRWVLVVGFLLGLFAQSIRANAPQSKAPKHDDAVPGTAIHAVDEHILRHRMFAAYGVKDGDLPYTIIATGPTLIMTRDRDYGAYASRWLALAEAFVDLTTARGKARNEESVRQFRHGVEQVIERVGTRPNAFELHNATFEAFLRSGLIDRLIAYADSQGSSPPSEIPKAFAMLDPRADMLRPGVYAAVRRANVKYPCEAVFMFCSSNFAMLAKDIPGENQGRCVEAQQRLMQQSDYHRHFMAIHNAFQKRAKHVDLSSGKEVNELVASFFSEYESSGLAERLDREANGLASVKGVEHVVPNDP
jgi:hypothetical protein